jgi:hypothetical protein
MTLPNFMTHGALDSREAVSMILRRIGMLSLGKFFCFLYGLMGFLFGALVSLASLLGAALHGRGPAAAMLGIGMGAIIVFPLIYGFLGFIAGIIGAALFNLVASMVGGVEIELSEGFDPPARSAVRPDPYFSDPVTKPGERGPGFHS